MRPARSPMTLAGVGVAVGVAAVAYILCGGSYGRKSGSVRRHAVRGRARPRGLPNAGNTCFVSAVLQAVSACPAFVRWLEQLRPRGGPLVAALADTLKAINGGCDDDDGEPSVAPVLTALRRHGWTISCYEQQDAHEFFHILITSLEEELEQEDACRRYTSLFDEDLEADQSGTTAANLPEEALPAPGSTEGIVAELSSAEDQSGHQLSINGHEEEKSEESNPESNEASNQSDNHEDFIEAHVADKDLSKSAPDENQDALIQSEDKRPLFRFKRGSGSTEGTPWQIVTRSRRSGHQQIPLLVQHDIPFRGTTMSKVSRSQMSKKAAESNGSDETPTVTASPFSAVPLNLPDRLGLNGASNPSLHLLLRWLVSSERVGDDTTVQRLGFGRLPPCLCLHIQRTTFANGSPSKRHDHVDFACHGDMRPYSFLAQINSSSSTFCFYSLKAVVVHIGPVDSGHYVTYRQESGGRKWYLTSDHRVESVRQESEVLRATAYMLFYERVSQTAAAL